jgi:hypothetical protein
MRSILALIASASLLAPAGLPDAKIEVRDLQNHPFSVNFPSGHHLRMHIRSGEILIKGSTDGKITVRLEGRNADHAEELTVRFKQIADNGDLEVYGGPKDDIRIVVAIPETSNLFLRVPFGDVTLEGVSGDKDVELHAGDLTIGVGSASDYAHVDASVTTGDIDASPFGENHGGLFRSFEKSGTGRYTLHAHVGAGDLTLH